MLRDRKMPSTAFDGRSGGEGENSSHPVDRLLIEGIHLDNVDNGTALRYVELNASNVKGRTPRIVLFVNVHSLHMARRDSDLLRAINSAHLVLPDGSGLALAGKVLGHPIGENLNGTDFSPRVLNLARDRGWSVFLFGGKEGVAERCKKALETSIPGLKIVGTYHGHTTPAEEETILALINALNPDLLLVGMGTPLQEKWIVRHAGSLAVGMCFGVGGLFDFLAGEKPRAPLWIRRAGLEWVFRFFSDPASKWDRVFVEIPLYVGRVFTARLMRQPMLRTATQFSGNNHEELDARS